MSRRKAAPKRAILPDPKYGDTFLAKFINVLMEDGKKSIAEAIVYNALDRCESNQVDQDAMAAKKAAEQEGQVEKDASGTQKDVDMDAYKLEFFKSSVDVLRPKVEVKSRRIGGATYQVPIEVPAGRSQALAMRWLVACARERSEKSMGQRLYNEMVDAKAGRGAAFKKREDVHRMAAANKAFAHFRW